VSCWLVYDGWYDEEVVWYALYCRRDEVCMVGVGEMEDYGERGYELENKNCSLEKTKK